MSPEILRRAAALMRERAEAAPPGPWEHVEAEGGNRDERRTLGTYSLIHDTRTEVALVRGFSSEREPVAEHIASWHPAVALAVADWLDVAARDLWAHGTDCYTVDHEPCWECDDDLAAPHVRAALAVARAYLGEGQ